MTNIHYSWSTDKSVSKINISIPSDIKKIIEKGKSISRLSHPEYPKNVFFDNVEAHILRLVKKASTLKIESTLKDKLIRMLWIHDAPEIYIESERDVTSVEKDSNPELYKKVSQREDLIAEQILNKDDQKLYFEFEKSKDALKSGIMNDKTTFIGLVARILDITDGNMSFHYFLSNWIKSHDHLDQNLPPNDALTYTFRFTKTSKENIAKLDISDSEKNFLVSLLDDQMKYVTSLWKEVGIKKIPESIKVNICI